MTREDVSVYSDKQIKALLPTIWSEDAKLNPAKIARDPDEPKGPAANPAHSGDHMAHCADISRAWERAFLTLRQKQVLLLRYGMSWEQEEIGEHFGITKQSVHESETRGLQNISTFLNGKTKREDNEPL